MTNDAAGQAAGECPKCGEPADALFNAEKGFCDACGWPEDWPKKELQIAAGEEWVQNNQLTYRSDDPGHFQFYGRSSGAGDPIDYLNSLESQLRDAKAEAAGNNLCPLHTHRHIFTNTPDAEGMLAGKCSCGDVELRPVEPVKTYVAKAKAHREAAAGV